MRGIVPTSETQGRSPRAQRAGGGTRQRTRRPTRWSGQHHVEVGECRGRGRTPGMTVTLRAGHVQEPSSSRLDGGPGIGEPCQGDSLSERRLQPASGWRPTVPHSPLEPRPLRTRRPLQIDRSLSSRLAVQGCTVATKVSPRAPITVRPHTSVYRSSIARACYKRTK